MLLNMLIYLALKDNIMRAKYYEKVLNKYNKKHELETEKIEQLEITSLYTDSKGYIDWTKLAKHVNEATSGR